MFAVNYRDPRPIYEQIADELRKMIVAGVIAPDEKLPSVRELAQQLAICSPRRSIGSIKISPILLTCSGTAVLIRHAFILLPQGRSIKDNWNGWVCSCR